MRVLVACECSGKVREEFRKKGHDAWSCDINPPDDDSRFHYQCDVRSILDKGWELLIGHPPCTYMSNSGVRWLHSDANRWPKLFDAADFFLALWKAPIKMKCLENPMIHMYAKRLIGVRHSQVIHPWMFGHKEQKPTCLWLEGLPLLRTVHNVKHEMEKLPHEKRCRMHHLPGNKNRSKIRSETFKGVAEAMANQWGILPSARSIFTSSRDDGGIIGMLK